MSASTTVKYHRQPASHLIGDHHKVLIEENRGRRDRMILEYPVKPTHGWERSAHLEGGATDSNLDAHQRLRTMAGTSKNGPAHMSLPRPTNWLRSRDMSGHSRLSFGRKGGSGVDQSHTHTPAFIRHTDVQYTHNIRCTYIAPNVQPSAQMRLDARLGRAWRWDPGEYTLVPFAVMSSSPVPNTSSILYPMVRDWFLFPNFRPT